MLLIYDPPCTARDGAGENLSLRKLLKQGKELAEIMCPGPNSLDDLLVQVHV